MGVLSVKKKKNEEEFLKYCHLCNWMDCTKEVEENH